MSRNPTVESLESRKADLLRQVKELDTAIKAARDRETAKKQKQLLDALAAKGLLDRPIDELIAALGGPKPAAPMASSSPASGTQASA